MLKLKQKGKNPDYPKEAVLWRFTEIDNIPDWVTNNFQMTIRDDGIPDLVYRETSKGYQIIMFSGETKKIINIKDKKEGGLIASKTHGILYLWEKAIDLLYDKKELRA
jgi:hypothetical protein